MNRWLIAALLVGSGCNRLAANLDFERMIDQSKVEAYEASPWDPEVRGMQRPPAGTVPRERPIGVLELSARDGAGRHWQQIPVEIDRMLLERGRDRYERFCAACHGVLGYGNEPVAENMALRPPPSLHEPEIVADPPGDIFETITAGYGLMPSYRDRIEPTDRWAIVAYLQALWLSQNVALSALPSPVQDEARRQLP